ncbi:microtubule-associated proteins 1A/1B light chain 3C-like [Chiloscyllium plagiosum]|uniref:microtubule-associated proteins 1A/1B light chain 3C-like n=1 Tax=Chiloscyllium plagiosum TaxID=36176 RepID=UPI001CB81E11|nr:microtubule-associated proteins 1A/1B light chain 3C-like [Chiloscyllium plagiosum]
MAVVHRTQRFKHRKAFAARKEESTFIRSKYPQKIPVIVERYPGEKHLKQLDKTKFLVPQDVIVSHFITIIRNRLALTPNQAFYLVVKNKSLSNMYATIAELDQEYMDSDGFLYISYASQEMFGAIWPRANELWNLKVLLSVLVVWFCLYYRDS